MTELLYGAAGSLLTLALLGGGFLAGRARAGRARREPLPPRFVFKIACVAAAAAVGLADIAGALAVRVQTGEPPLVLGDAAKIVATGLVGALVMGMRPSPRERGPEEAAGPPRGPEAPR